MPLFLSEEEFALIAHDAGAVADRADSFIRELRRQLDTAGAEFDAASISAEQTCALLEQRYATLSADLDRLKSENEQLVKDSERDQSRLAEIQAEKHQIHLKAIGKDGEVERLTAELAELQKSKRQLLELVEQKDAEIRERNATVQSYLDKIVHLTDNSAAKETRSQDIEMELTRCHATCNRLSQEKELLEKHNNWLDEELTAKTNTLAEMRRNNMDIESQMSARIADLERELNDSCAKLNRGNERVAELEQRNAHLEKELSSSKEVAATNEQHLNAELSTVSKLVELYKESSSEWSKKAGELEGVIKALETHLTQVENEYKEKLEKEASTRQEFEKAAAEMREKLDKCEAELENSRKGNELSLIPTFSFPSDSNMNKLVLAESGLNSEGSNEQMMVPKVPAGVSGTALAASLLRDGWSLAKMYEKYQDAADALRHEMWGRRHAEAVLERILHEIEQKAELILDERAVHERMVEAYSLLNQKLEQALLEHDNFENIIRNLKCELKRRERDHDIAQQTIDDLQNQIAVLLKECQDIQIRCGFSSISTSLISAEHGIDENDLAGHMSFKDISGVVEQNVELKSRIQSLSAELDRRDEELKEGFQIEMQRLNDEAASKVEAVLKRSEEQGRMIESLHTSVAMYKRLYEEERRSRTNGDALPKGPSDERNGDVLLRIEGSQREASKKDHDHLMERARKLEQDLTALKDEVSALQLERGKLALEAEFSKERLNSAMLELEHQRKEANAVSARNVELTQLIIDYQKRVRESSDSVQAAEDNVRKLSMEISISKHEKEIFESSEKRAMEEIRNLSEKVHRLQSSLDTIQTTEEIRENARASEKRKQEEHIKQREQEWAQSKKELQEEKDHVLSLTIEKKISVENYTRQIEELRKELSELRQALSSAESRTAVAEAKYSDVEKKAGRKGGQDVSSVMDTSEVNNDDAWKIKEELDKVREEAQVNKTYMQQYKEIAQTTEAALKQIESAHEEYKAEAERSKRSLEEEIASLRTRVSELQKIYESKCQEAASAIEEKEKELFSVKLEVSVLKDEISEKTAQVETMQLQVSALKDGLDTEHKRWRTAQDNYERQVILQSETIQELTNTSKELSSLQSEIAKLRDMLDTQKAENEHLKASWEHEKLELRKERDEAQRNYNETNEQNKILHNRLEALHVRLADKEMTSAGYSMDSKKESDVQNVISYLRRSKEIAETEISLLKKEKTRLQSELEMTVKSSQDSQALLRSRSESAKATVLKDEEFKSLQLQVREVNLLRESNIQLREENKHNFEECQKLREEARKAKMEAETSRSVLLEKQIDLEACQKELEMRRTEVENLNARITEMVENNKKVDPKEHEQMRDELQQIKALMRENGNELEQTKNLILEKEKVVAKLEENLAKCQAELSERDSKLNSVLQSEASLRAEADKFRKMNTFARRKNEMFVKEKEEINREKESLSKEKEGLSKEKEGLSKEREILLKEKEGLSKEKEGFLKQVEELKSSKKSVGESSYDQSAREKDTRIQMLERILEKERSDKEKERNEKEREKAKRQKHEQVITVLMDNAKNEKQKVEEQIATHRKNIAKLLEGSGMTASQLPSQGGIEKQTLEYFMCLNNLESNLASTQEGQTGTHLLPETSAPEPSIPPARQATPPPPVSQAKATEKRARTLIPKPSESRKISRRFVRPSLGDQPQPDTEMPAQEPTSSTEATKTPPAGDTVILNEPEIPPADSRKRGLSSEPKEREESGEQGEGAGAASDAAAPPQKRQKEEIATVLPTVVEPKSPEIPAGTLEPVVDAPVGVVEEIDADQLEELLEEAKEEDVNMNMTTTNDEMEAEEEEAEEEPPVEIDTSVTLPLIEEGEAVQSEGEGEGEEGEIGGEEEGEDDREEGELPEEPDQQQDETEGNNDESTPSPDEETEEIMLEADEAAKGGNNNDEVGEIIEKDEKAEDDTKGNEEEVITTTGDSTITKGNEEEPITTTTTTTTTTAAGSNVVLTPETEKSPQKFTRRPRLVRGSSSEAGSSTPATEAAQGSTAGVEAATAGETGASPSGGGRTILINERARQNAALRQARLSSTQTPPSRARGRPAGTGRARGRARGGR